MKIKIPWWILTGVLLLLLVAGVLLMGRDMPVTVDGQTSTIHTYALTVGQALNGMGIKLSPSDQVEPSAGTWLSNAQTITLTRSRQLTIWIDPSQTRINLSTTARTAREALAQAGITPAANDQVKLNGTSVGLDDVLPAGTSLLLQYTPALPIQFTRAGQQQVIHSAAATLGQALWENGIRLTGSDLLTTPFTQLLTKALDVTLTPGIPLTISVDGKTLQTSSAAATVGQALAGAGISLQNLDYSKPAEDSPLPKDGKIQVIRVKLVVLDQQEIVPYTVEYTTDSSLAAGTKEVTRNGQNGINNTRILIRYENGSEVSRQTETKVVVQVPINEQMTIGPQTSIPATPSQTSTAGSIGTINTGNGVMSYYLSVSVHATSYSPCRSGGSGCSYLTASGQPVAQGVLGVTSAWYKIFKGYQIYIPGYGIGSVQDIGGGIPGEYWIDLGYSDSDWVNWSKWVTVYFLTPVPPNFSGTLP